MSRAKHNYSGTRHFFLLTFNNLKNIGGHAPPPSPSPQASLLHGPWTNRQHVFINSKVLKFDWACF